MAHDERMWVLPHNANGLTRARDSRDPKQGRAWPWPTTQPTVAAAAPRQRVRPRCTQCQPSTILTAESHLHITFGMVFPRIIQSHGKVTCRTNREKITRIIKKENAFTVDLCLPV